MVAARSSRSSQTNPDAANGDNDPGERFTRRHLRFGWWCLVLFAGMGLVLESLHGLKVGWYLNHTNETRRLMLRLAHAHGTLLALVNIAFAVTVHILPTLQGRRVASWLLLVALFVLPGGFSLGGIVIHDGDPGLCVLLVPVGAVALISAGLLVATAVTWWWSPSTACDGGRATLPPRA